MKSAFWKTFHRSGEIWFDYLGDDDECERSTDNKWHEFVENLAEDE